MYQTMYGLGYLVSPSHACLLNFTVSVANFSANIENVALILFPFVLDVLFDKFYLGAKCKQCRVSKDSAISLRSLISKSDETDERATLVNIFLIIFDCALQNTNELTHNGFLLKTLENKIQLKMLIKRSFKNINASNASLSLKIYDF